jgi:hypothetical protein
MEKSKQLSCLWLFAVLNYLYCDILGLMDAHLLRQFLDGKVDGMEISQSFLLGASILMEIPITMVLIAALAAPKLNRILNIITGIIMTLVQTATLLMGEFTVYYAFFSAIEISATLSVIVIAWKWKIDLIK